VSDGPECRDLIFRSVTRAIADRIAFATVPRIVGTRRAPPSWEREAVVDPESPADTLSDLVSD
jgi:hypothetical protein